MFHQNKLHITIPAVLLILAFWTQSWIIVLLLILLTMLLWTPQTKQNIDNFFNANTSARKRLLEWGVAILLSIMAISFANTYLLGIYTIQSPSMQPAYQSGNTFLMNKIKIGPAINVNSVESYRRLLGFRSLKAGDVIVFNFPEGDSIIEQHPEEKYYLQKRLNQYKKTSKSKLQEKPIYKSVKDRPRFIKRVIGLPGDTLEIKNGNNYINSKPSELNNLLLYRCAFSEHSPSQISKRILEEAFATYNEHETQIVEVSASVYNNPEYHEYLIKQEDPINMPDLFTFPFSPAFLWNASNWGPAVIPAKGQEVKLTLGNLPLYKRIIETYEENSLEVKDKHIYINQKKCDTYTFKLNYYWVAGDNKPHSFDSRYWGFLPENHIIGVIQKLPFFN